MPRKEYSEFDKLFLAYAKLYVDVNKSASELSDVLDRNPSWVVPRAILAIARGEAANSYDDVASIDLAIRDIRAARAVAPNNPFVLVVSIFVHNVGRRMGRDVDRKAAEEAVSQLENHPTYVLGHLLRAEYYHLMSPNDDKAEAAWFKVFNHGGSFFWSAAAAQLHRRGHTEFVRKATPPDAEAEIAQAMILALSPETCERARRTYHNLVIDEKSWDLRYKLAQLALLLKEPQLAARDCKNWLDENMPVIRKDRDSYTKLALEYIRDFPDGKFEGKSRNSRFKSHFVQALCAYANGQPDVVSHLKKCSVIRVNWTPEMYWVDMLLNVMTTKGVARAK